MKQRFFIFIVFLLASLCSAATELPPVRVAVASNFSLTLKKLVKEFEEKSEYTVSISQASTGKLFAQIVHGAPYDIFFAADEKRPEILIKKNLASKEMMYAQGQLVMLARESLGADCKSVLDEISLNKLAIANPKIAPYGRAAKDVLISLGKWESIRPKLVMGENILQTYQFLLSGSVDAGFIAKSLVVNSNELATYCQWHVPARLYKAIKQKAVVLKRSGDNLAVKSFFNYIQSDKAKKIIRSNGYRIE